MKSYRITACLLVAGVAALSGCSSESGQKDSPDPAASAVAAAQSAGSTPEAPTPPAFDYGEVLGNLEIGVKNEEGYSATISATVHDLAMRSSIAELPAWCAGSYTTGNKTTTLFEASSIIMLVVESTVSLDPHDGFPEPAEWAPTVDGGLPTVEDSRSEDGNDVIHVYSGKGECVATSGAGPEPTLTDEGYEMVFIDLYDGRGTPSHPLPATLDEIPFFDREINVSVDDAAECTVEPTDKFAFGGDEERYNSPERNNGSCSFVLVPQTMP